MVEAIQSVSSVRFISIFSKGLFVINKVHHLRGEASKIEDEMKIAQDDLDDQEQEVNHLRNKLKRMGSRDSLYVSTPLVLVGQLKKIVSSKEFFLT